MSGFCCPPFTQLLPEAASATRLEASSVSSNRAATLGTIRVNRYVVTNQGARAVVLYWYQTPRRVIESEWTAKFWLIPDSIRDRRTDTSLVRIVTWANQPGSDGAQVATDAARAFGEQLYPVLREWLPR